ncbi:MAG: hypothetical protein AB4372_16460, partial [Xenococcus sp. (in: cyanobacteria)]
LHTTVELPDIPTISNRKNGAVGVDLNANNLAWAYCDSEGNLKDKGQINYNLRESSSGQITHILSLAIGEIIEVALKYESPIVIEKLDFSAKKASLFMGKGIKNNQIIERQVSQIDVAPTLARLMGFTADYAEGKVLGEVFV